MENNDKILRFPLEKANLTTEKMEELKNMSDQSESIKSELDELQKKFEERLKEKETTAKQPIVEKNETQEITESASEVFCCKACNTEHTKNVIPFNLLVYINGKNAAPVMFLCCPNCGTIQLPQQTLNRMLAQISSGLVA